MIKTIQRAGYTPKYHERKTTFGVRDRNDYDKVCEVKNESDQRWRVRGAVAELRATREAAEDGTDSDFDGEDDLPELSDASDEVIVTGFKRL